VPYGSGFVSFRTGTGVIIRDGFERDPFTTGQALKRTSPVRGLSPAKHVIERAVRKHQNNAVLDRRAGHPLSSQGEAKNLTDKRVHACLGAVLVAREPSRRTAS